MTETEILASLKIDLGITATAYDDRLLQYIRAAEKSITSEGVTLDFNDIEHIQLIIMYATWQWKKRESGQGMPRMVRYQLNNLIFKQSIQSEE